MTKRWTAAVILGLFLAACSTPSVPVETSLGLEGREIELETTRFIRGASLIGQQQADTFSQARTVIPFTATFGNQPTPNVSVGSLTVPLGYEREVTLRLQSTEGSYPATLEVTRQEISIELFDASASAETSLEVTRSLTLTRQGACADVQASCTYRFNENVDNVFLLVFTGDNLSRAESIIFGGPSPNTVQVSLEIDLEDNEELPAGTRMVVTLSSRASVVD